MKPPDPTRGPALLFNPDGTFKARLLFGIPDCDPFYELLRWMQAADVGPFTTEFHRLQVEHWVWRLVRDYRERVPGATVLDVGVYHRRTWLGPDYRTVGIDPAGDNDLWLDLSAPDAALPGGERVDVVVCTEVLEHCTQPFAAVANLAAWLKPGGLLIASSPFIWPDHHTDGYPDYWRFTRQGWELLFDGPEWADLDVTPCLWTQHGRAAYDLMLQLEAMVEHDESPTGFLVRATRA